MQRLGGEEGEKSKKVWEADGERQEKESSVVKQAAAT